MEKINSNIIIYKTDNTDPEFNNFHLESNEKTTEIPQDNTAEIYDEDLLKGEEI